jgi:glycosyltransferase involved in cell wall biosynthesis
MPRINDISDVLVVHLKDLGFFRHTIPSKTQVSMASGRPVLMAVRGDAADIINKTRCGITCQPENEREMAEAIIRMYRMEKKELAEMGERGRRFYLDEMSLDRGGSLMESLIYRTVAGR